MRRQVETWHWLLVAAIIAICIILGFASQKKTDELKTKCDDGSTTACIEYDNALRRLTEPPVRR